MAADVSRQIKSSHDDSKSSAALITRDFLGVGVGGGGGGGGGGGFSVESEELDLDLHVPFGWEKRLDLKSGKVYVQRSTPTTASSDRKIACTSQTSPRKQDMNFAPQSGTTLDLFVDTSLELKPVPSLSSNRYQSVCTLDKVKLALDRAERQSCNKKRSTSSILSVSSPSNSSSLSMKEMDDDDVMLPRKLSSPPTLMQEQNSLMVAAACPGCLLYVLIPKNNPKCPRCNALIQMPLMTKKPRIDLNISI